MVHISINSTVFKVLINLVFSDLGVVLLQCVS